MTDNKNSNDCIEDEVIDCEYPHCDCSTQDIWTCVDNPPEGENRILHVFNPEATFDTGKQRLMYYRKEEGFPDNVTHWKEKDPEPINLNEEE